MAIGYLDSQYITDIADAIRAKDGSSSTMTISEMPQKIANIPSGGGEIEPKDVTFYDWDGTILHTYTLDEAHNLTALPPLPPAYKDYTADSWTETLQYVQNLQYPFNIGVNYTTTRTDTKFYITLDERRLDVVLYVFNNNVTVDWGDGTSGTYSTSATHTYSQPGNYVVSAAMRNLYSLNYGNSDMGCIYAVFDNYTGGYIKRCCPIVTEIELGNSLYIGSQAFMGMFNLNKLLIPKGTRINSLTSGQSQNQNSFSYSYLKFISLPQEVVSSNQFCFCQVTQLERFVLPSSLANNLYLGQTSFQNCNYLKDALLPEVSLNTNQISYLFSYSDRPSIFSLERIVVPDGLTYISNCINSTIDFPLKVRYLKLPSELTTMIENFRNYVFVREITFPSTLTSFNGVLPQISHFTSLTPPTATFAGYDDIAKIIYVPASAVSDYQTAWTNYASIIQAEPTT